ncbi:hypothetical protein F66182_2284 [Fusarium sp. NRRL 66182]|nr:hypothetical protein F66182_2284 [Fusarium sp. NRRL 66182]
MRVQSMGISHMLRWFRFMPSNNEHQATQALPSLEQGTTNSTIAASFRTEAEPIVSSNQPGPNETHASRYPEPSCTVDKPLSSAPNHATDFSNRVFTRPLPDDSSRLIFYGIPASSPDWSREKYEERFQFVTCELNRAVTDHDQLRSCARFINYSLRMIGNSADTADACILIECRKCDLKALQNLFHAHTADRLYCRKDSKLDKYFNSQARSPQPSFKLVFLHTSHDPLCLYASYAEALLSFNRLAKTLCGALVEYHGRKATVGLVLEIDGVSRLLTVGHLFDDCIDNQGSSNRNEISSYPGAFVSEETTNTGEMASLHNLGADCDDSGSEDSDADNSQNGSNYATSYGRNDHNRMRNTGLFS